MNQDNNSIEGQTTLEKHLAKKDNYYENKPRPPVADWLNPAGPPITHWLIVALLVVIIALQAVSLYNAAQLQEAQAARLENCQVAAQELVRDVDNIIDLYNERVYGNTDVDTIHKQTFVSLEHQLFMQKLLATFTAQCY
jgi:hypothetical protein